MNYSSIIKVPDEKTLEALCAKTFNQLLIHPNVIRRIRDIDYKLPTAIQSGALPLALSGKDLIVQSPPESGKTLVFAAVAAHIVTDNHQSKQREPFVTILAASSEHVTNIKNLIVKLVPDGKNVCAFYGDGDDFTDEKIAKGCSVVIGTPDRLAKLCGDGGITIKLSQLLIIDDADKLMAPTFVENIQSVFKNRGSVVQVAAFCSSYPDGIEKFLRQFMESPSIFRIDCHDVQLSAAYRDDKVVVEDNTREIDDGIDTSQSDQLSKNASSIESSTSPTKTLPGSSRNANVDEPLLASHSAAVQLSAANRDKVTPETDDSITASQSEQLSKNVPSDESSASPTKTSSGDRQGVQLNTANRDDMVAIKDDSPKIDRDVKENAPEKATSQSDQLSKNVTSNEPLASPTKTSSGGVFGQSNGFGTNDGGQGSTCGGSRSSFEHSNGFGAQNNGGFGSTRGGRGGFGQSSGFGAQNNDGNQGFGSTRGGSIGGFGAQNNDGGQGFGSTRGGSRGGYGQSNGFASQNNDSGFGSTRGGRVGFGQSSGFGAQNNDSGFSSTRGGSRGGFGGGGSRGGYNRSTEFGGDNQMNSSRGGFGRAPRGSYSRGGFGQSNENQQYSNGFGENQMSLSGATRGGFGGGRGGFGTSNSAQDQMNSSGFNRDFPSRGGSFGGRGGSVTSDSAENQINSPVLNRGGSFHSNSEYGQSSHGGFGSGFGHPAADNSQDAPAPEEKPQPLVLGHRFVR